MAVPTIPHISPSTSPVSSLVRKFNVGDPVIFSPAQLDVEGNRKWLKDDGVDPDALYEIEAISVASHSFGGHMVKIKQLPSHHNWGSGWFELAKNQVVRNILNDL